MTHARYEHITSSSNPTIKLLRGLDRKKIRLDSGLFISEGERHLREALKFGWSPKIVLVSSDKLATGEIDHTLEIAEKLGARILTTTPKLLSSVSRKDNAQTVIAAFEQKHSTLEQLESTGTARFIALFEVRDPGNLGTILRTADAAGVAGVILVDNCCDPFSVECVRATMGALFSVKVVECHFNDLCEWRTRTGAQMIAASINGDCRHDMAKYTDRTILLMGNEQSGIPSENEKECDTLVRIPMAGAADSLNLAQATAIMTYQIWKEAGYDGAH